MIIHNIDQNSAEWFEARRGMPTASSFDSLITPTGKASTAITTYAASLAAKALNVHSIFDGNDHTERGHELEPMAADYYEFVTGRPVEVIGFITDDDETYGCSPDRLVDDGMVEIKCLSAEHHIMAIAALNDGKSIKYMPQVQGEMLIAEKEWNDLVFFHPDLPSKIHRVYADKEYQKLLLDQIWKVIAERDRLLTLLQE